MAYHSADFDCPECDKRHRVEFSFSQPEDKDEYTDLIKCGCGCEFEVTSTAHVEIEFTVTHPEIIKSGIKTVGFDINDTSTWPQENNPNQLNLL